METVDERYDTEGEILSRLKDIVNDSEWNVDLVMDYYGEWLGSEGAAIILMMEIKRLGGCKRVSYGSRLRELRQLLIEDYEFTCEDIPFTRTYRRRGH